MVESKSNGETAPKTQTMLEAVIKDRLQHGQTQPSTFEQMLKAPRNPQPQAKPSRLQQAYKDLEDLLNQVMPEDIHVNFMTQPQSSVEGVGIRVHTLVCLDPQRRDVLDMPVISQIEDTAKTAKITISCSVQDNSGSGVSIIPNGPERTKQDLTIDLVAAFLKQHGEKLLLTEVNEKIAEAREALRQDRSRKY